MLMDPVTVGTQESEQENDGATAGDDDDFSAHGLLLTK